MIGPWAGAFAVANLIATNESPELSLASKRHVPNAHVTMNARFAADPVLLETHVSQALHAAASAMRLEMRDRHTQCFRPGQPMRLPVFSAPIS